LLAPETVASTWLIRIGPETEAFPLRTSCNAGVVTVEASMIRLAPLVAYLSAVFTLEPGDLIFTGTPPGVGMARQPPVYLKGGDSVEIEIDAFQRMRGAKFLVQAAKREQRGKPVRHLREGVGVAGLAEYTGAQRGAAGWHTVGASRSPTRRRAWRASTGASCAIRSPMRTRAPCT